MTVTCHVRFLGGLGPEMAPGYPVSPESFNVIEKSHRFGYKCIQTISDFPDPTELKRLSIFRIESSFSPDFYAVPKIHILSSTYFASQNKYYKGVIKNINRGGAFIETKAKSSTGQKLKLVTLGTKEYILLRCEIMYINQVGFGVKFKSILKKGKAGI